VIHFLFPCDPLGRKKPDELVADQHALALSMGFSASLFDLDELQRSYTFKGIGKIPEEATVVYRGWMLTVPQYGQLVDAILSRGATPLTQVDEYARTHWIYGWYHNPVIQQYTTESRFYNLNDDHAAEFAKLGWGEIFIKDYVKSLKTAPGSIADSPEKVTEIIRAMRQYRELEGGITFRRAEEYVAGSERRYFILNGTLFSLGDVPVPMFVYDIIPEVRSKFFSLDVAQRVDGGWRLIELGDGQVSDIVNGWTADIFMRIWA